MARRLSGKWWIAGSVLLGASSPTFAAADLAFPEQERGIPFAASATLSDAQLDELRGGFELPNGMDVVVGVDIQTLVNGALALRSVLNTDTGTPVVFVGDGSGVVNATGGAATGGVVVRVGDTATTTQAQVGEQQVMLTVNGPAVSTPSGAVQLIRDDNGSQVLLSGDSLELRQMIGSLTGSIVANTANDRTIDTVVTINVDVQNSGLLAGNAMLRADSLALDTAGRGIR